MPYLKIDELIIKKVEADEANLLEDYFGISENKFVPVLDNLRNNELDNTTDYQHLCSFAALQLIRTIKIQKIQTDIMQRCMKNFHIHVKRNVLFIVQNMLKNQLQIVNGY